MAITPPSVCPGLPLPWPLALLAGFSPLEAAGITEGAVFRRIFNKRNQRVTDRRLAGREMLRQ